MSITSFAIWFRCFWNVICPDWWTIGIWVVPIVVCAVFLWIYSQNQVKLQTGTLIEVGKRWQWIGYGIIAAVTLLFLVEILVIHACSRPIVANRSKPQASELQTLLRANEIYFNKLFQNGHDKFKGQFSKFRNDIVKNDSFSIKEDITYADARKLAWEKEFSSCLAANSNVNVKLPKLYSDTSDSNMKRLVGEMTMKRTGYLDGDERKLFNTALFAEFAKPEYKDVLPRLAAELKKNIANRQFNLSQFTNDDSTLWSQFAAGVNNNKGHIAEDTIRSWANQDAAMVANVFKQKASAIAKDKATFNDLLPGARNEFVYLLNKYRDKCFAPENIQEILKESLRKVNSDPDFAGLKDNQMFNERKEAFWREVNGLMLQRWREDLDINFIRGLEEKRDLLFSDDKSDQNSLTARWMNLFNLNKSLTQLLNIANILHNIFWLVVIFIVVLLVFILRGKKICNMGKRERIEKKLAKN